MSVGLICLRVYASSVFGDSVGFCLLLEWLYENNKGHPEILTYLPEVGARIPILRAIPPYPIDSELQINQSSFPCCFIVGAGPLPFLSDIAPSSGSLVCMDRRAGSLTKLLLHVLIRLPPLLFRANRQNDEMSLRLRTAFSWLSRFKILYLNNVLNALAFWSPPAPASYFSLLLWAWLLALAPRLLRRRAHPAAGARTISCLWSYVYISCAWLRNPSVSL